MTRQKAQQPSALDDHLGFWMRMVSNQVSAQFARSVNARGVSVSEWVALRRLLDAPSSHRDLVEALGMTKGAVSKVARSLEEKNLISRTPDPQDGRAEALVLTRAGRALVPKLAALADANDAHFFGHLPAGEREALRATLESVVRRHGIESIPVE
jgi:DNA-binding MarR family transcriptional regulator